LRLRQGKHAAKGNIDDYLPKFDEHGMMQGMVRRFPTYPESEVIRQGSASAVREAID